MGLHEALALTDASLDAATGLLVRLTAAALLLCAGVWTVEQVEDLLRMGRAAWLTRLLGDLRRPRQWLWFPLCCAGTALLWVS